MFPLNVIKTVAVVPKNYHFKMDNERKLPEELKAWNYRYGTQFLVNFIILTVVSTVCRALNKYDRVSESEISNMFLACVGIAGCYVIAPLKNKPLQCVTILMMVPAMLLYNVYTGVMYDLFNYQPNGDINSLSELSSTDLRIVTNRDTFTLLENTVTDPTISAIMNRVETFASKQEMMEQTNNRQTAFIRSRFQAELMVQSSYDSKGYDLYHIVPETVHEFYQAMVGRRNFPLLWKINELTARMIEAGVVQRECNELYFAVQLQRLARVRQGKLKEPELRAINLEDLLEEFFVTSTGWIVCAVVFIVELIYHNLGPAIVLFVVSFIRQGLLNLKIGRKKLKLCCTMSWKKFKASQKK